MEVKSVDQKQLTQYKSKTTRVSNRVADIEITDQETLSTATDILSDIKSTQKAIKADKEKLTKPLNQVLRDIRAKYKPFETDLKEAESGIKSKMADYQEQVERELAEKEAEVEEQLESGEITPEKAAQSMEQQDAIGTSFESKKGKVQFKTRKAVRVTDVKKVPVEYLNDPRVLTAITTAVRKDALDGKSIPGVEVYEERSIAAS